MSISSWMKRLFARTDLSTLTARSVPPPEGGLYEYLYVDEPRLDSYVEQVRSPRTWDKVPQWEAEIALPMPKATGKQISAMRNLTRHEKLRVLMDHLKKTNEYAPGRPSDPVCYSVRPVLRSETFEASCAVLPVSEARGGASGSLKLWFSDSPAGIQAEPVPTLRGHAALPGRLFLLQDDPHPDESSPNYFSAYSTLKLLSEVFGPRLLWTPERTNLAVEDLDSQFARDPLGALRRLGAQVGPSRWVTALYRIRTGTEMVLDSKNSRVVTFGYPIVILAGSVSL